MMQICVSTRHGAEQYAGDLECVFYGNHLDRAILKIAEAAYCFMPSLVSTGALSCTALYTTADRIAFLKVM